MEVYRDNDRVVLDLGQEKRQVLFASATARLAAAELDRFAGQAATCTEPGFRDREPSIEIDAILNRNVAQVRLRFGWWATQLFLTAQHAINLATWLRLAADKAEAELKWAEEADPKVLLT